MARNTIFNNIQSAGYLTKRTNVATITTAGAVTYSAAQVAGGLILRDPNGAGRTDVFPTAANLFAEVGPTLRPTGMSFEFTVRNTADAAETITLGGSPAGVTYSGTMTIAQNNTKTFLVVFTSPAACTVYSVGTFVH